MLFDPIDTKIETKLKYVTNAMTLPEDSVLVFVESCSLLSLFDSDLLRGDSLLYFNSVPDSDRIFVDSFFDWLKLFDRGVSV